MNLPTSKGQRPEGITRDILLDIIFTILTLGLFNLYVQYKQMQAVNFMLGREKYNWIKWFLFSFITCGLYHLYHEYIKTEDIAKIGNRPQSTDGLITLLLCLFGLSFVADAIQQSNINRYYGVDDL